MVPVKSFALAKGRLAGALSVDQRAGLARRMASGVLAAAGPLPAWVVCDDNHVAGWARAEGAGVIHSTEPGLNEAARAALAHLARSGYDQVIIAHGDLPLAVDLTWVGEPTGVTIVRDRRGTGTNVLSLPTGTPFVFAYGPGSATRHRAEAERVGLAVRVVDDERLGWDVDTPDDLAALGFGADAANRGTAVGAATAGWPPARWP